METHDEHDDPHARPDELPAIEPITEDWWDSNGEARRPRSRGAVAIAAVGALGVAAVAFVGVQAATGSSGAGSAASSLPASGGPGGGAPGGQTATVTKIAGTTLTVTSSGTTQTVNTSSSTTVTKDVATNVKSIKVGDQLIVMGAGSATAVTAQRVVDSGSSAPAVGPGGGGMPMGGPLPGANLGGAPPNAPGSGDGAGGAMTLGTVKSISGSALSITTSSGSPATVTLTSSTDVRVQQRTTLAAVHAGDQVQIESGSRGAPTSATVTATAIRIIGS